MAKVEELTRQLEELRGRQNVVGAGAGGVNAGNIGGGLTGATGHGHLVTPASVELEKLRRELMVKIYVPYVILKKMKFYPTKPTCAGYTIYSCLIPMVHVVSTVSHKYTIIENVIYFVFSSFALTYCY